MCYKSAHKRLSSQDFKGFLGPWLRAKGCKRCKMPKRLIGGCRSRAVIGESSGGV